MSNHKMKTGNPRRRAARLAAMIHCIAKKLSRQGKLPRNSGYKHSNGK